LRYQASRLLLAVPLALALLTPTTAAQAERPAPASLTAMETVAAMQPGWNLGNTLDSMCCGEDETSWGNPMVTEELMEGIRAQGFNSIRIPVSWTYNTGPAPDYTVEPQVLDRVEEVVQMALDEDLYVMINIHHDSWQWMNHMPTDHDNVLARYNSIWTQIAETFKDYPSEVVFESVNEPQFDGSTGEEQEHELLAELNASFHEIVRSSGGDNEDRLLVLPTLHTSGDQSHLDALSAEFEALDDPMLAATTHNYSYWPFSVNIAGKTTYDEEVQGYLEGDFARLHDTFVSKGIPMIIGEFGLLNGGFVAVEYGEAMKFFEHFGYLARTNGITTMFWDNGQYFDRTEFDWQVEGLHGYLSESWTNRSGTAESDLLFVDPAEAGADQPIALNPNGLQFKSLYHGDRKLKPGRDYTLQDDTLTLKASLVDRLLGDGAPGTREQLSVRFSDGVPWTLNVIASDTPVLEDATGTTDAFAIPTEYNGDMVATLEATYADGTGAGPHDWTVYKEYGVAYDPDYENGLFKLTPTFFDAVTDGAEVHLTVHFRSGKTVAYTVTKNGTAVTGSA
jgi:endoglucanase